MKKVVRVVLMASLCTGYVYPFAMDWKLWGIGVGCTLIGGIGSFICTYSVMAQENNRLQQVNKTQEQCIDQIRRLLDRNKIRFNDRTNKIEINDPQGEISLLGGALTWSRFRNAHGKQYQWATANPLLFPDNFRMKCSYYNNETEPLKRNDYTMVAGKQLVLDDVVLNSMITKEPLAQVWSNSKGLVEASL